MRISGSIKESLRDNDQQVRTQTIAKHRSSFNKEFQIITHFLNYIIFLYDESLITLIIRGFIHVIISSPFDEEWYASGMAQIRLNSVMSGGDLETESNYGRMFQNIGRTSNRVMNSNSDSNNNDLVEDSATTLDWDSKKRRGIVRVLLIAFTSLFMLILLYQGLFCLGNTYSGFSYGVWGGLDSRIRNTVYTGHDLRDTDFWNSHDAYSGGYIVMSLIGETKLRSKLIKFITILILDFLLYSIFLIQIVINFGIQLGIVKEYGTLNENSTTQEDENFDGYQGRAVIYRISINESLKRIFDS